MSLAAGKNDAPKEQQTYGEVRNKRTYEPNVGCCTEGCRMLNRSCDKLMTFETRKGNHPRTGYLASLKLTIRPYKIADDQKPWTTGC